MRLDFVRRDIRRGIFEKLYHSNLRQLIIGFECSDQESLDSIRKEYKIIANEKTINWIHQHCPKIFVQGTFINGMWNDDQSSFKKNLEYARRMNLDLPGFGALKPFPGTELSTFYKEKGLLDNVSTDEYRFDNTVVPTKYLDIKSVDQLNSLSNMKYIIHPKYLFNILFLMSSYRRKMHWIFFRRMIISMIKKITDPLIK